MLSMVSIISILPIIGEEEPPVEEVVVTGTQIPAGTIMLTLLSGDYTVFVTTIVVHV